MIGCARPYRQVDVTSGPKSTPPIVCRQHDSQWVVRREPSCRDLTDLVEQFDSMARPALNASQQSEKKSPRPDLSVRIGHGSMVSLSRKLVH